MAKWDGKSHAGLLGYKIFVLLLRYGGLLPAYFVLLFVSTYYYLFSIKSSKHIYKYLRNHIEFGFIKSIFTLYQNYFIFGQTLVDRVAVIAGLSKKFSYDFEGEDYLHQMVKENKGGILISAHIGNWEIAGHLLYRIKAKIHVVMHVAEHEKIKSYLEGVKGSNSMNVIVLKDDFSHIYEICIALSKGEIICMHGDRYMPWSKKLCTDFLGKPANFPEGPFALAVSMKVPVSYVFAMKESLTHYQFSATKPIVYTASKLISKHSLVLRALNEFKVEMEEKIKNHPVQWFNYYDFWSLN